MISKHPFEPFIPNEATKLIIGTIPPQRFCIPDGKLEQEDVKFYYGSRDNEFWRILGEIFNRKFPFETTLNAIEERKSFLTEVSIGIIDMIESCIHRNGSASDEDIIGPKLKDLEGLLMEYPNIGTLIYTSENVKKLLNGIKKNLYHEIDKSDKRKQKVKIGDKKYDVVILYSPSPQALRNMGNGGKEKRLEQYRQVFIME